MKTILAPVDFSNVSSSVVAEAAALARFLDGKVVLLTVVQPPTYVADYAPLLRDIAEITSASERSAAAKLARLKAETELLSPGVEAVQRLGDSVTCILEEAERIGADYIVMGSHGHTALYDLFVGSTTHGVLKRAGCPVVIVPAGKAAPAPTEHHEEPALV